MKLRRVALQHVRGVTASFELDPGTPMVVTGPAASGKTTVLDSIAAVKEVAGGYGPPPLAREFQSAGRDSAIEVAFQLDEPEQRDADAPSRTLDLRWDLSLRGPQSIVAPATSELLRRYDVASSSWKAEYFNSARHLADTGSLSWTDPSARLVRRRDKYGWVRRFLVEAAQQDAGGTLTSLRERGIVLGGEALPRTQRFAEALSQLNPRLMWVGCEMRDTGWSCIFARRSGAEVELASLSDSEKMAVLVAGSFEALGLARSLILIDHPEQGLHPEDHMTFFQGLCSLFAEGQVVATTSSPAILRSLRREQVVVLGDQS